MKINLGQTILGLVYLFKDMFCQNYFVNQFGHSVIKHKNKK